MTTRRVLPGFGLSLGYTLTYLSLLVLIPLAACFLKASKLSWDDFWAVAGSPNAVAAYKLSFGASLGAAAINVVLGVLLAWVLVRYEFPGKRFVDSLVDLPFALPTAVAGLVYSSLYVENGWLGRYLVPLGIELAYSRGAIVLVLTFVSLPFVVRTLQPVLENMDREIEEAAQLLGATRWQTFYRVILPSLRPAIITGFALAFARALGEFGSVIFVSSNIPGKTQIAPMLIVEQLEQLKETGYNNAAAIAVVLLVFSFILLGIINLLERWSQRNYA